MNSLEATKSWIWKTYFITSGVVSLIFWNTILNLTEYFAAVFPASSFTFISFVFCFGSILSFFIAPALFQGMSHKSYINFSLIMCLITFALSFYSCEATERSSLNWKLCVTCFFLLGFFNAALQARLTGMAAYLSKREIVLFNFGTGLAGVGSNILAWLIELAVFGMNNKKRTLHELRFEVIIYCGIIALTLVFFFFWQLFFDFIFPQVLRCEEDLQIENVLKSEQSYRVEDEDEVESILSNEKNQISKVPFPSINHPLTKWQIIWKCLDLLLGLTYLLICTIIVVAYFDIKAFFLFDKPGTLISIPVYMFCFNLADTAGKFIPEKKLLTSAVWAHLLNGARTLLPIYFVMLIYGGAHAFWRLSSVRLLSNVILGLSNGYLINSFMALITDRFHSKQDKSKAAYYAVLFLFLGVVSGSFVNLLIAKSE